MLGAALITASAAHGLLCLATLPGLINAPYVGFIGGTGKVLGILWTIAGALLGAFLAMQALSVFKGMDYGKARIAAIGTLFLPLVGLTGGIAAFALVPIGAAAWWLLRQPSWKAAFEPAAEEPVLEVLPEYQMEDEAAAVEEGERTEPPAEETAEDDAVLR